MSRVYSVSVCSSVQTPSFFSLCDCDACLNKPNMSRKVRGEASWLLTNDKINKAKVKEKKSYFAQSISFSDKDACLFSINHLTCYFCGH